MENSIETSDLEGTPEDSPYESDTSRFHLSPLSLVAKTISGMRSLIFPLLAVSFALSDKINFIYILIGFAVIALITLGFTYWAWKRFSYQIGAEEIRIESGILSRNARSIPYERIQDVSIEQSLIPRLLGISAVKFETGGSEGDEGSLEFVSADEAENLRQLIRARKSGVINDDPQKIESSSKEIISDDETLFSMDVKRIFTLGTFNFSLVLFAVIIGVLQQFEFLLPFGIEDIIDKFADNVGNKDLQESDFIDGFNMAHGFFGIAGGLIVVVIIGMLSGQVQTFLREYGFTLTETDRGIRRQRGLLTLTDVVMPLHRVQAVIVQTGFIRKRFGWYALKFTSLGSDTGKESSHMMVPLAKDHEYWPIAQRASIHAPDMETHFGRSHLSHMAASIIFSVFIFAIISTLSIILPNIIPDENISIGILNWIWIVALIPFLFGYLGWRYHFHAMDEKQIYVKSGFWNQKMTILPMVKAQTVDLAQGPLSQYLKVADIKFGIAGGSGLNVLTIHNIPIETARSIRQNCIDAAKNIDFSDLIKAPKE